MENGRLRHPIRSKWIQRNPIIVIRVVVAAIKLKNTTKSDVPEASPHQRPSSTVGGGVYYAIGRIIQWDKYALYRYFRKKLPKKVTGFIVFPLRDKIQSSIFKNLKKKLKKRVFKRSPP